jgi:hypothetical protein
MHLSQSPHVGWCLYASPLQTWGCVNLKAITSSSKEEPYSKYFEYWFTFNLNNSHHDLRLHNVETSRGCKPIVGITELSKFRILTYKEVIIVLLEVYWITIHIGYLRELFSELRIVNLLYCVRIAAIEELISKELILMPMFSNLGNTIVLNTIGKEWLVEWIISLDGFSKEI